MWHTILPRNDDWVCGLFCGVVPDEPTAFRLFCSIINKVDEFDSQYARSSLLSWYWNTHDANPYKNILIKLIKMHEQQILVKQVNVKKIGSTAAENTCIAEPNIWISLSKTDVFSVSKIFQWTRHLYIVIAAIGFPSLKPIFSVTQFISASTLSCRNNKGKTNHHKISVFTSLHCLNIQI